MQIPVQGQQMTQQSPYAFPITSSVVFSGLEQQQPIARGFDNQLPMPPGVGVKRGGKLVPEIVEYLRDPDDKEDPDADRSEYVPDPRQVAYQEQYEQQQQEREHSLK